MATGAAKAGAASKLPPLRLPERLPDLHQPWLRIFELFWFAALIVAMVGPVAGMWYRFTTPGENSALMLGGRVGLALAEEDLTRVRFPVGSSAKAAGIQPGDHIIAIDSIPLSKTVPLTPGVGSQATDTDYALFGPLIQSGDPMDLDLTLRANDGTIRQYHVRTGEQHIEQAAGGLGLSPALLSVVDLLHVLTYPFLLFAAWILHRRKREDLISSILSLAVLLTIASEQPSAAFLTFVAHVPEAVHQRVYDLGNICLLAGILLFPFGELRPRVSLAIVIALPVLFFLSGDIYRLTFVIFMVAGVLTLLWRLQNTPASATRQQIKWALFGFSGYALFLATAFVSDMMKLRVGSFTGQLSLEVFAGLSFGLAFLSLQLGLLIALLRYRLYDAEVVISRSANFAMITILIGGVFAGANEAVKVFVQGLYGPGSGQSPGIFAAAVATVLVTPAYEKIQRWSEKKFQRNLYLLRDDLPECVRDMRETASLTELLEEVLVRIERGVRAVRTAAIVKGDILNVRGVTAEEVEKWRASPDGASCAESMCESADRLFPIRLPLIPSSDDEAPLGFILVGPRPDGSVISKDEQKALTELSEPIARAIRNVVKREAHEQEIVDLIGVVSRRVEQLEAKLYGTEEQDRKQAPGRS
jgi:hypothetical protein